MIPYPLLAYGASGSVVAVLHHVVARDADGNALGLIDFAAYEAAGGPLTDIWRVSDATGSGTWPEWLGLRAYDFTVVLDPSTKRIAQLVHKTSGFRRVRAQIEAAIAAVPPDANGVRDIRAIVGGPTRPLALDNQGRTIAAAATSGTPAHLPLVGRPTG